MTAKKHMTPAEMQEIKIVAQTIYGESRGESLAGMRAVADVIANRAGTAKVYLEEHGKAHPLFGDGTFASACLRPWQFSCWNHNDPNYKKLLEVNVLNAKFLEAHKIATLLFTGELLDETQGATHYYSRYIPAPPSWAKGKKPCVIIGNHLFFNNID